MSGVASNGRQTLPTTVRIGISAYSDLMPGTEGIIVGERDGGYAVEVTALFEDASRNKRWETRIMWFGPSELLKVPAKSSVRGKPSKKPRKTRRRTAPR